jgi:hypothetical protein
VHIKSFSLTSAGEKFALDSIRRQRWHTRPGREREKARARRQGQLWNDERMCTNTVSILICLFVAAPHSLSVSAARIQYIRSSPATCQRLKPLLCECLARSRSAICMLCLPRWLHQQINTKSFSSFLFGGTSLATARALSLLFSSSACRINNETSVSPSHNCRCNDFNCFCAPRYAIYVPLLSYCAALKVFKSGEPLLYKVC